MHKRDKQKILNIVLIPDSQEALPKNIRLSYTTISVLSVILAIVLISMIVGMITYSQVLQAALEKNNLEKDNIHLREQLKKTQKVQTVLDTLKIYREKIRSSLQGYVKIVDKPDEDILTANYFLNNNIEQFSLFSSVPLKVPVSGFVSRGFAGSGHSGVDIVASEGTPITAAASGIVIFSGWTNKRGNTVILYHPLGYLTYYQHNARNLVVENQNVSQGDVIGFVGNSGETSSGPHLHFEIWKNGQPVDPFELITDLTSGE